MTEFRTIEELAAQVGRFCWLEHQVFALTGVWASQAAPDQAAVTVFFHAVSSRHGELATRWRSHLPVRAGVDADGFVVPPPGTEPGIWADLEGADQLSRLHGLVRVVLPRLHETYAEDLTHASPVSEAPVRAVLELALHEGPRELAAGEALLQSALQVADEPSKVLEFGWALERSLNDTGGIFPSAWAS
jgi:hypothetical protein